jgi:ABC-2 type transport system ATP-binding protein
LETILSIKTLKKRYGTLQALDDVSFDIRTCLWYFRSKWQRKSTTLGIVLNVVNKTSGEYSWFNGKMETMKH